jgi:hypothetical protein
MFYLGAKGMCKTMFLHFMPVDGVYYFPQNCWRERYVFMFLCVLKTSLWTRTYGPIIVSRKVSHCTGYCRRTCIEYTVGMFVRQQSRNSKNLPNHKKDVIGSHRGISVDLLLVQPYDHYYYKKKITIIHRCLCPHHRCCPRGHRRICRHCHQHHLQRCCLSCHSHQSSCH